MERLSKKYAAAKHHVPAPIMHTTAGASSGIIGFGSTEPAILEAMHQLEHRSGLRADFMRVRALPFSAEVDAFLQKHDQHFVVEMNRDGQLHQLLCMAYPDLAGRFRSIAFQDGLPASAAWVREGILEALAKPLPARRPKALGRTAKASDRKPPTRRPKPKTRKPARKSKVS
jgi:2-oxoglutarate ferredoxin oxidoreductase subunit alpha